MSNCKLQETSFTNISSSSKSIDGSSSNLNITEKPSEKRPNLYQLGPVKKHHTTDVSCAYCFIVFVVIWIMIPLLAYRFSDAPPVLWPTDSWGNICGWKHYKDRPYIFFFNIFECVFGFHNSFFSGCQTPQICVKECPDSSFSVSDQFLHTNNSLWLNKVICIYNTIPTTQNIKKLIDENKCASYYFISNPILKRCIPVVKTINEENVKEVEDSPINFENQNRTITIQSVEEGSKGIHLLLFGNFIENFIDDLSISLKGIIGIVLFGTVISAIWAICLHHYARLIVWSSMFMLTICMLGFFVFSVTGFLEANREINATKGEIVIHRWVKVNNRGAEEDIVPPKSMMAHLLTAIQEGVKNKINEKLSTPGLWLFSCMTLLISLFFFVLMTYGLANKIDVTITLIDEVSRTMFAMTCGLLVPIIPYTLKVINFLVWGFFAIVIQKTGRKQYLTPDGDKCQPQVFGVDDEKCSFHPMISTFEMVLAEVFNLCVFFWINEFIEGAYFMILANCYTTYFWKQPGQEIHRFILAKSAHIAFRYHTGSIACGSAIISGLGLFSGLLECFQLRSKKAIADDPANICANVPFLLRWCKVWLRFLDWLLAFLSYNTYVLTGIFSIDFYQSARESCKLIDENPLPSFLLSSVTSFVLIASRLCILSIISLVALLFFNNRLPFIPEYHNLNNPWFPILISVVISFVVNGIFLRLFQVGVDTMFICFLIDEKINDGSSTKPYFMSNNIRSILQNPKKLELKKMLSKNKI